MEVGKDARVVIEVEAVRLHGYAERNSVLVTAFMAVGRDPQNPMVEDDSIRTEKIGYEMVVKRPEDPADWVNEMADALEKVVGFLRTHEHLDIGAFVKYPQPIRIARESGSTVGILDAKNVRVVVGEDLRG